MLLLVKNSPAKQNNAVTTKQQDVTIKDAEESKTPAELQGSATSLLVNGDLITRGSIKISNGGFVTVIKVSDIKSNQTLTLPSGSGTLCTSTNNCDYASTAQLNALLSQDNSLQGQVNNLTSTVANLGQTAPSAGVASLNSQTGAVGIQGSLNQVIVNTSGGMLTLSTPQDLDANANVQFGNLAVSNTGIIRSNNFVQTGAGNNVSINAGNDMVTFTAGGRVFQLPNSGGASQTICTSGTSCASGAGAAVLLSQTTAQTDNTADASIFINDTGGGHLLRLQTNGVDTLTVANNGNTVIAGSLSVATLGNGFVKSTAGALSVSSAINLTTDVTGTLPVGNGGTGAASLLSNGVLVGNGASPVSSVTAAGAGLCLVSTAGAPSFQACPGADGVASVNGENGAISIVGTANQINVATGPGTITLSTPQNLHVAATPTFAGLTLSGLGSGPLRTTAGLLGIGNLNLNSEVSGLLGIANGGTGVSTTPTNGQLLIGNGTGYSLGTLSNIDGTVLITNGAGSIDISVPRAGQCDTCADFTLSNLADVIAINKSLLPASAGAINLGGSTVPYSMLYLSGTSLTPASNNFTITGVATSARTISLPDASGTVCLRETCIQLQTGSPPGTAQTGNINLNGTITASNLTVSGTATINTLSPAANTALVLGATGASQTTNLQGSAITFTNGSATYTFNSSAAGSQTICDTSGNCAGAGGGVIASGGSAYNLPVFTASNTIANSIVSQDAGGTAATVTGVLRVTGNTITGTGALTIGSTGGANAVNLNSTSGTVGLTGTTATVQRVGSSLTFDINSAASSTLTVSNSNVSNVANLSVEGGISIGSGQTYKINGTDINTAGTLNNVAYLNQNNSFTGVGNTSFAGTLTGGTYNGQTISSSAALTGTLSIAGANALSLGQASTNSGAIVFRNSAGVNTVTLKAGATNPGSSFSLTLPSALGTSGDCLEQIDASGTLGFVGCASGLGGSGTTGTIALFSGAAAVGDSLLTQSGSVVSLLGSGNSFQVDGTVNVGINGASGNAGKIVFNDGSNPGRAVTVQAQQAGSSYTLLLPTTADVGTTCLRLENVSAGVNKIVSGSCAAGGSGGNITASGTTNGHLLLATSDGPSYSAAASLVQDNGSGVSINTSPQVGYIFTAGSGNKFNVTDAGQLEIGTTGVNPLTLAVSGAISNVTTLTATGLLQTTASGQALSLSGAPTNSATQSLLRLGDAIAGGNSVVNGGTYLGINTPSTGPGSAADFVNFQVNGTNKLKVDNSGNVTAGTYNGVTIGGSGTLTTSGGYTLTLTGNSTLNQDLTTSAAVQFGSLSLTTALAPSQGGTGSDTSGALVGATLLFNGTTGKFEANRITSSDSSLALSYSDGNLDLQVASCATCANTDLSNLAATTNLNSTLQAQAGVDAGSASSPFRDLYISGSSASRSSNHFQLTGNATASRVITLPNADGTICLTTTCVTLQGGSPTPQSGYISVSNDIIAGGNLIVGATATINTLAPAASTALVLGATGAGQTSTLQGSSISFVDGAHTYVFSGAGSGTHTICDDTGNCAGSGGGVIASGGSAFNLPVFNNANTLVNSLVSQDAGAGATTVTVGGKLVVSATNTSGSSLVATNAALNSNNSNLTQLNFTNANTTASATTVNGLAINPTGSINGNPGANTLNGIRLNNVIPIANNSFYALNVGTGYDDILRYNNTSLINGSGFVQNLNGQTGSFYQDATNINAGTLAVARGGTGAGTFAQYGVLFGNGTGALGATAAGTNGQCLVATTGAAPTWSSCAGSGSGVTLQAAYDNSTTPATILLADGKDIVINAADTATDPSILFNLQCTTSCGSNGKFAVQSAGTDVFTVKPNGDIVVGTATNNITFAAASNYELAANGSARHTKKIYLTPEISGSVLDVGGCTGTSTGAMTGGLDLTNRKHYYKWTTSEATDQCYEVAVQILLPSDFAGWASTTPLQITGYRTSTGTILAELRDTSGSVETNVNYAAFTPGSASTWATTTGGVLSGTYAANGTIELRIRLTAPTSGDTRLSDISLDYLSKW